MKHLTITLLTLLVLGGCSPPAPPPQTFNPLAPPSETNNYELYDLALYCSGEDADENIIGVSYGSKRSSWDSNRLEVKERAKDLKALFISKDRKSIYSYTYTKELNFIKATRTLKVSEYYFRWFEDGKDYDLSRETIVLTSDDYISSSYGSSSYSITEYFACSISPMNELITLVNSWYDDWVEKRNKEILEEKRKKDEERERLERERKI